MKGDGLVLVKVTVVGELAGASFGFSFLLHVALERLHLLLVDIVTAIIIQLGKVPMNHPFLQCVAWVRLNKPGAQTIPVGVVYCILLHI